MNVEKIDKLIERLRSLLGGLGRGSAAWLSRARQLLDSF